MLAKLLQRFEEVPISREDAEVEYGKQDLVCSLPGTAPRGNSVETKKNSCHLAALIFGVENLER